MDEEEIKQRKKLPKAVQQFYGCNNCDWKAGSFCPHGLKKKSDRFLGHGKSKKITEAVYMCPERKEFIASLLDPKKRYSDLKDYRHDITLSMEHEDYLKYKGKIYKIEKKIKEIEQNPEDNKKELRKLEMKRKELHNRKDFIFTTVAKFDDKHLDRVAPRKIEVTEEKKLTIHQINELISEGETQEKKEKKKVVENYGY